jgi:hypothetical protein
MPALLPSAWAYTYDAAWGDVKRSAAAPHAAKCGVFLRILEVWRSAEMAGLEETPSTIMPSKCTHAAHLTHISCAPVLAYKRTLRSGAQICTPAEPPEHILKACWTQRLKYRFD